MKNITEITIFRFKAYNKNEGMFFLLRIKFLYHIFFINPVNNPVPIIEIYPKSANR